MKVAVYAIAKNEEAFVERWHASTTGADHVILLDTGSSDETALLADALGITTAVETFDPWRFDTARNAALDLIPDDVDYCIALDLDEQLQPGWRDHLDAAHQAGVTRPRYEYTWSWTSNGRPGLVYGGDKIHTRHGYTWRHPVHEVITPLPGFTEVQGWTGLAIHHHPDPGKSRGSYLPLLALAVAEDPDDDRNAHYYARELMYAGRTVEAVAEFTRHLDLPRAVWAPERAASMRYLARLLPDEREAWLTLACQTAPDSREPWVDLAQHHHDTGQWWPCLLAALSAVQIRERPLVYLCEEYAWGPRPHDLAAVAAHHLHLPHEAHHHGLNAVRLDPYDPRLLANLTHYERTAA